MCNNFFFKTLILLVSIVLFVSCDKEYSEIGDAIIGENNFDLVKDNLSTVQATWKKTGAIGSNNLDVNSLGVLDNAAFGQTTANFATQVQLVSTSPDIGVNLQQTVESVTLYIPYYTNASVTTSSDGRPIYKLDSIYGNKTSKIKLSIYENKYLLGSLNTEGSPAPLADPSYPQFYYTNQNTVFDSNRGKPLYNNNAFVFSPDEFKVTTPAVGTTTPATTTYIAPGMRLDLDKGFFQNLLFDKSQQDYDLSSNANFEKYFKGLYFNVEKADATGVLNRMNFKAGTIVVKYKEKVLATDAAVSVEKSITLNLTGNTVNLFNNEASTGIGSYSNPSPDRLYLRGGEGSIAVIDLFNPAVDVVTYNRKTKKIDPGGNKIADELDYLKAKGWLINEASLTFYVDQGLMTGVTEPSKIFLYSISDQVVLAAGVIEKDNAGKGVKYRAVITDYLRVILKNDVEDARLGISVAQVISNFKFKKTKDAPAYSIWKGLSAKVKNSYFYPESSVISPLGTILYGSAATVQDDKRLKLEIYYTKPN